MDSSNFNPQPCWNVGCQLVALNFQTTDTLAMHLHRGRFRQNAHTGYILKPSFLRDPDTVFDPNAEAGVQLPGSHQMVFTVRIVSGQDLPRAKSISPFVQVELYGLPCDTRYQRTETLKQDGMSPIWNEEFTFNVTVPELVLVRFVLFDVVGSLRKRKG